MSEKFSGSGEGLIVNDNNEQLRTFSSVYTYRYAKNDSELFSIIDYENSIIGKRKLSAIFTNRVTGSSFIEYASDGLLNFATEYFFPFIIVTITGEYNKSNYSSSEIDEYKGLVTAKSTFLQDEFKKRSMSEDEFNSKLEANPFLRKKYNEIISKK